MYKIKIKYIWGEEEEVEADYYNIIGNTLIYGKYLTEKTIKPLYPITEIKIKVKRSESNAG